MKEQDEGLSVSKDLSIEERKKILLDTQIDKDMSYSERLAQLKLRHRMFHPYEVNIVIQQRDVCKHYKRDVIENQSR